MKKLHWLGVIATILISAPMMTGCSGDPPPPTTGTAGTGNTAGAGGTGTMGVQLTPPSSYVVLSAADAPANTMPAPAAWTSATCSTCHGPNGEGTVIAPEVRHTPPTYAKWVVRNGRSFMGTATAMVAFPATSADPMKMPAISDADLDAVVNWLNTAPKPTTPQGLYKDFCGNCHGPNMATGGNVPINITGIAATEVMQKVRMGEGTDPAMRNLYMPPHAATEITDAEIMQIDTFIMAK
jgi:mono/diheme cytochrome c family protein